MIKTVWTPTLIWLAAAAAALVLALAAPSESTVMGRLPSTTVERLDQQRLASDLSSEGSGRTLALVAFHSSQRGETESWITGLQLHQSPSISWVRMPVINDPGNLDTRHAIESRLLARYTGPEARLRLMPIFTDREAFIRAAGLSGAQHAGVLVLGRDGSVLARAEGEFDSEKARALRMTLMSQF